MKNECDNQLSKKQKDSLEALKIVNNAILTRSADSKDMMLRNIPKADRDTEEPILKAPRRSYNNHLDSFNAVYKYQKENADKSQ